MCVAVCACARVKVKRGDRERQHLTIAVDEVTRGTTIYGPAVTKASDEVLPPLTAIGRCIPSAVAPPAASLCPSCRESLPRLSRGRVPPAASPCPSCHELSCRPPADGPGCVLVTAADVVQQTQAIRALAAKFEVRADVRDPPKSRVRT